jgi:antitoxin VapB
MERVVSKSVGKIFRAGKSQAIKLPAGFRIKAEEVFVERDGERIVLSPKPVSWKAFFASRKRPTADFMNERMDALPQSREEL